MLHRSLDRIGTPRRRYGLGSRRSHAQACAPRVRGGKPVALDDALAPFKHTAFRLPVRLGIACSLASAGFGALSTEQPLRRVAAAILVLAAWVVVEWRRRSWVPYALADAPLVIGAAAASVVPFAVDGHTQSNVFLAVAPLAGVAAIACGRRHVAVFAVVWAFAYLVGAVVGGGGPSVLFDAAHPFDVLQQLTAIVSMSILFAFAVYRFRGFVVDIPRRVDELRAAALGVIASLTEREAEVLWRLGAGQTPLAIAEVMNISQGTVEDAIKSAMGKLGAHKRHEAVFVYYLRNSMPERTAPISEDELDEVGEALRQGLFVAAFYLALLLVLPAMLMVVLVDEHAALRLILLGLVGVLCGLAAARGAWCFQRVRDHESLVMLPAGLMAIVIAIGGGPQNATFVVCVAVLCALGLAAGLWAGLAAGVIVAAAYLAGMVARGQPLITDGSPGDLVALAASLLAIYAAFWVAGLPEAVLADLNGGRRGAAPLKVRLRRLLGRERRPMAAAARAARNARLADVLAGGEVPLPPKLRELGFSDDLWDVAYRSARGMKHDEIADARGTSRKTIETQVRQARDLLHVDTPSQMAAEIARAIRETSI